MAKLIIWVGGKPIINGYRKREFHWSETYRCYIYGGTEIEDVDFNAKWEKAYRNHADMSPQVRVVSAAPAAIIAPKAAPVAPPAFVAPQAHRVTPDEALEVLARERPELLKKRGPRPATLEVA